MKLFIWVQHLFGRGHVRRMARIASACAANGIHVTVAAGGPGGRQAFADLTGVVAHQLPALGTKDASYSALVTAQGDAPDDAFWALRREALFSALHSAAPDVVMVELFPFGRRKFAGEVLTLIEAAKAMPAAPKIISSVRDIVETKSPEKMTQMAGWMAAHFDAAFVHGDEAFIGLPETAPFAAAATLHYTGYVAPSFAARSKRGVVVSAGSSPTGEALLSAAIEAAETAASAEEPWHIFVLPGAALPRAANPHAHVHPYTEGFADALAGAEVSISEAGYNTFAEVMAAGAKAVLAPYGEEGQTEQPLRAARAELRGLATIPDAATPAGLLDAVARARALPKASALKLDGAGQTATLLKAL